MKPILAPIAILLSFQVLAQQVDPEELKRQAEATPMNTFRFIGNALACKMDKPDDFFACNRIGDFKVGDAWSTVSGRLGTPWRVVPRPNGAIAMIYVISATPAAKAYWVIENRQNKIASVQLTGNYPVQPHNFSTIQLGDFEQKVLNVLGPRYSKTEVSEIRGVMWNYAPFPITIEFVDGRVYSMRVAGGP